MSAWAKALDFTLKYEGGWVNDPNDKGGETFRGISRKNWPSWEGWAIIDGKRNSPDFPKGLMTDVALLGLASDFYKKNFWDAVHGDELPEKMAMALFDFAVNSGVRTAIRCMQIALTVNADGIIGPATVAAAHKAGEMGVIDLLARRAKFLHEVMDNDPTQKVWAMNWFKRLFKLADIVLEG